MQRKDGYLQSPTPVYYNPHIKKISNNSYKINFTEIGYLPENSKPAPLKDVKIIISLKYYTDSLLPDDPRYYSKTLDNYVRDFVPNNCIFEEIQYFDMDNDNCLSMNDSFIISNITLSDGSKEIEGYWLKLSFLKNYEIFTMDHGDRLFDESETAISVYNFTSKGRFSGHITLYTVNVEISSINELYSEPYLECVHKTSISQRSWIEPLFVDSTSNFDNGHHYVLTKATALMKNDYALILVNDIYNNETVRLFHI